MHLNANEVGSMAQKTRLESVFIPEVVSGMKNSSHAVGKNLVA